MGLGLYYTAFLELDSERQNGWSVGRIPWHSIVDYAATYGIVGEQREDLIYLVRAMDTAFVKYHQDKNEKKGRK